jgi:hypothetical protein
MDRPKTNPYTPSSPSWWDLLKWVYLTIAREEKHYASDRSLTLRRLQESLRPALEQPIFIVGTPRSGTTFLGQCIGALPSVSYHFEPMATKSAAEHVYTEAWANVEAERFYRFVYRNLLRLHLDGDLRFAEKTPRNCFVIPFLHRTFPDAQFVFIVRDGRDAALSHSKKPWMQDDGDNSFFDTGSHRFGVYPRFWVEPDRHDEFCATSTFHRCVWAWRRHTEAALQALDKMPEAAQCRLQYESFVQHPTREMHRLLEVLEVPASEARHAVRFVTQNVHTDSVGAWREELAPEQRRVAAKEAGALLERFGYIPEEEASVS